jgi:hypothetical protein
MFLDDLHPGIHGDVGCASARIHIFGSQRDRQSAAFDGLI